jgi:hypothetical protein
MNSMPNRAMIEAEAGGSFGQAGTPLKVSHGYGYISTTLLSGTEHIPDVTLEYFETAQQREVRWEEERLWCGDVMHWEKPRWHERPFRIYDNGYGSLTSAVKRQSRAVCTRIRQLERAQEKRRQRWLQQHSQPRQEWPGEVDEAPGASVQSGSPKSATPEKGTP